MLHQSEERVLRALAELQRRQGYPPTRRELLAASGWASLASLQPWLLRLRERGLVAWDERRARGVRLTVAGWKYVQQEGFDAVSSAG